mgnify:CR=1 FL=1
MVDMSVFQMRVAEIQGLQADLTTMIAPNEDRFMAVGQALAKTRQSLAAASGSFQRLSDSLDQGKGGGTIDAFANARDTILTIAHEAEEIADRMAKFRQDTRLIRRPLTTLATIINEISALATNAKVQAAQVNARDVDFSVFTNDIGRLRVVAAATIKQATERLSKLETAMEMACRATDDFRRANTKELLNIAARMSAWLHDLRQHREQARLSAVELDRHSQRIAVRVAACIGELQLNDLTSQRIEHVRTALGILHELLAPGQTSLNGCEWLADLSDERKEQILAAVCQLQAHQTDKAAGDFVRGVGQLKKNLTGLSQDAGYLNTEANRLFGGGTSGSFMQAVYVDVDKAALLLERFRQANETVRTLIADVAASFTDMAEDLRTINSIDADMRVMGLNATFKCSRLGTSGLALGVVAQELRACSRRTDENARAITSAIAAATAEATALSQHSGQEQERVAAAAAGMAEAARTTRDLDRSMTTELAELSDMCRAVSDDLGTVACQGMNELDQRQPADEIVVRLKLLGASVGTQAADPQAIRADVERMLGSHYTMESERIVHELFTDDNGQSAVPQRQQTKSGQTPSQDIDDLFF